MKVNRKCFKVNCGPNVERAKLTYTVQNNLKVGCRRERNGEIVEKLRISRAHESPIFEIIQYKKLTILGMKNLAVSSRLSCEQNLLDKR